MADIVVPDHDRARVTAERIDTDAGCNEIPDADIINLARAYRAAVTVLKELEWSGTDSQDNMLCPVCLESDDLPHNGDCDLAIIIGARRS